jgi:hypothetical protein
MPGSLQQSPDAFSQLIAFPSNLPHVGHFGYGGGQCGQGFGIGHGPLGAGVGVGVGVGVGASCPANLADRIVINILDIFFTTFFFDKIMDQKCDELLWCVFSTLRFCQPRHVPIPFNCHRRLDMRNHVKNRQLQPGCLLIDDRAVEENE